MGDKENGEACGEETTPPRRSLHDECARRGKEKEKLSITIRVLKYNLESISSYRMCHDWIGMHCFVYRDQRRDRLTRSKCAHTQKTADTVTHVAMGLLVPFSPTMIEAQVWAGK